MNRFELVFPTVVKPASAPVVEHPWLSSATPGGGSSVACGELLTLRPKPGTSVRRLRNHRSKWPRR